MSAIDATRTFTYANMSRKANRELAARQDLTVERHDLFNSIDVWVKQPDARVLISLDYVRGVSSFMGHWVAEGDRMFKPCFMNSRSPRPHHKATSADEGFNTFLATIARGLREVKSGAAFVS